MRLQDDQYSFQISYKATPELKGRSIVLQGDEFVLSNRTVHWCRTDSLDDKIENEEVKCVFAVKTPGGDTFAEGK